jgi:hypothetical protein
MRIRNLLSTFVARNAESTFFKTRRSPVSEVAQLLLKGSSTLPVWPSVSGFEEQGVYGAFVE